MVKAAPSLPLLINDTIPIDNSLLHGLKVALRLKRREYL
jgi:hypothetical protein